jgi:predicted nucleic acid-binding protein
VAYLSGATGPDVEAVAIALEHAQATLPPVVLTELLSDPKVSESRLLARGRRARPPDTLIAQSCLDHDLPLVTQDSDFRHFARLASVRLVVASARR